MVIHGENIAAAEQVELTGLKTGAKAFPISPSGPTDFGPAALVDLSEVSSGDTYRINFRGENSPSFPVADDVWKRALAVIAGYQRQQRCGLSNTPVHPPCHLDDARRRDTGAHVDTSGGWHDAGDLRKWVDATLMDLFGMKIRCGHAPHVELVAGLAVGQ